MKALLLACLLGIAAAGCLVGDDPEGDFSLDEVREWPQPAAYFVGEEFEGLPLTAILGRRPMTFVYGDCDVPFGSDGGCAPPLEVQLWPIEQRPPSLISTTIPCRKVTVRGAPGAFFGGDLDLYVGEHTIVIFGESRDMALRAAAALRPVGADAASAESLPPPSIDVAPGLRRCSS
ncbi:MAG TPA: hypothetical protein VFR63_13275 [Gaiellaceae bacterium]|nr:hypothetical protein [Gaiellaceae bacterium]